MDYWINGVWRVILFDSAGYPKEITNVQLSLHVYTSDL